MAALTRDAILQRDDIPKEQVGCPEWGGSVTVRGLTVAERNSLASSDEKTAAQQAIVICAIDDKGAPLFEAGDVEALGGKNPAVIDRLAAAIMRLSGVGSAAEAEKN